MVCLSVNDFIWVKNHIYNYAYRYSMNLWQVIHAPNRKKKLKKKKSDFHFLYVNKTVFILVSWLRIRDILKKSHPWLHGGSSLLSILPQVVHLTCAACWFPQIVHFYICVSIITLLSLPSTHFRYVGFLFTTVFLMNYLWVSLALDFVFQPLDPFRMSMIFTSIKSLECGSIWDFFELSCNNRDC